VYIKEMVESKKIPMEYRYLGNSGLKVFVLSFGNWLNLDKPEDYQITRDAMKLCFDAGLNFFDTAEVYGLG
jgi:aryl-alcohol dehydrogenase-like predicted oxidoreductase